LSSASAACTPADVELPALALLPAVVVPALLVPLLVLLQAAITRPSAAASTAPATRR